MPLPQWIDDSLSFSCTGCGGCCTGAPGYIWINEEEIEAISTTLSMNQEEFLQQYCEKVGEKWSLRELPDQNYDCVFLDGKRCTIYEVRPVQCRTYPFWPSILNSEADWKNAARECEGIRPDATPVPREEIERQLSFTMEKSAVY